MSKRQRTIDALNDLLQKNVDASRGYEKAGKRVEHTSLEAYLRLKSKQRRHFSEQLQSEISSLGGEVNDDTSLEGGIHRAWMDIKATVAAKTDEAVFEECVRGERHSLEDYEEKLTAYQLPPSARSLLIAQRNQVEKDLANAKSLEELTSY